MFKYKVKNILDYSFYSTQKDTLLQTLAKLSEKLYNTNKKTVLFCEDKKYLEEIDKVLWTYSTNAFIPHGTDNQDFQSVWLTNELSFEDNYTALIHVNDFTLNNLSYNKLEKILFVFSIDLENHALLLYEELKKNKKSVNYWNQSPKGWVNKL